jgi:hypothetical protein
VFDRAAYDHDPAVAPRSASRVAAMSAALAASAAMRDSVYQCAGTPRSCTLHGASTLISLSDPAISGDTATIRLSRLDRTASTRAPVSRKTTELVVVRTGGRWHVVTERRLSSS